MLNGLGAFQSTLSDIASYFSVPSLGGLYYPASNFTGAMAAFMKMVDLFAIGMPIYPDKYEESGGNEIGTQTLVGGMGEAKGGLDSAGVLTKIMDNVVVSPRVWKIHGYIGINVEHNSGIGTLVNNFSNGMPVWGQFLTGFVAQFGRDALNLVIKKYIKYISEARRPFKFTTSDGETVPALVVRYSIKNEADNLNWVDVDLEIEEFRFVSLSVDGQQIVIGSGSWGSFSSMVKQMARCALKKIALR